MSKRLRKWLTGTRLRKILGIRLGLFHQYAARTIDVGAVEAGSDDDLPAITIVTPSLNQGAYIGATVSSVLSQEYPTLQYIIQDGGSTDTTLDVLRAFPPNSFELFCEKDAGQADALNRGFARANGVIYAYLNADDILLEGALKTVGRFFRDHPEVDVVYGNRLVIDESGCEIGRWLLPGHAASVLRQVDYVPQETLFWRATLAAAPAAQFDAKLQFAMDWALLLRFLDQGARFAHIPRLLGGFRVHADQKTQAQMASTGRDEMARLRERYAAGRFSRLTGFCSHGVFLARHWWMEHLHVRPARGREWGSRGHPKV
ncbi:glycosyltransferase family 2 protein [Burkholderia stagnalis]|uniref:glycosyltransferase family 2 protein n=1 Tax=Burkholderia stagnalis TaxID=1503054 RepID=UPI0007C80C65|nr:glycosyltransferase family 2 protein [Burkholderia stagnalis]